MNTVLGVVYKLWRGICCTKNGAKSNGINKNPSFHKSIQLQSSLCSKSKKKKNQIRRNPFKCLFRDQTQFSDTVYAYDSALKH